MRRSHVLTTLVCAGAISVAGAASQPATEKPKLVEVEVILNEIK